MVYLVVMRVCQDEGRRGGVGFFFSSLENGEGRTYGCWPGGEEESGVLEPGLRGGKVRHFALRSRWFGMKRQWEEKEKGIIECFL